VLPPRLPGVHVCYVDFHKGYVHAQQCVPDTGGVSVIYVPEC
jgi:hypothetical protein